MTVIIGDAATDIEDRRRVLDSAQQWRIGFVAPGDDVDAQSIQAFKLLLRNDGGSLLDKALNGFCIKSALGQHRIGRLPCRCDIIFEEVEQHLETDRANALHAAERDPVSEREWLDKFSTNDELLIFSK